MEVKIHRHFRRFYFVRKERLIWRLRLVVPLSVLESPTWRCDRILWNSVEEFFKNVFSNQESYLGVANEFLPVKSMFGGCFGWNSLQKLSVSFHVVTSLTTSTHWVLCTLLTGVNKILLFFFFSFPATWITFITEDFHKNYGVFVLFVEVGAGKAALTFFREWNYIYGYYVKSDDSLKVKNVVVKSVHHHTQYSICSVVYRDSARTAQSPKCACFRKMKVLTLYK